MKYKYHQKSKCQCSSLLKTEKIKHLILKDMKYFRSYISQQYALLIFASKCTFHFCLCIRGNIDNSRNRKGKNNTSVTMETISCQLRILSAISLFALTHLTKMIWLRAQSTLKKLFFLQPLFNRTGKISEWNYFIVQSVLA